jgi:hypothetical protein
MARLVGPMVSGELPTIRRSNRARMIASVAKAAIMATFPIDLDMDSPYTKQASLFVMTEGPGGPWQDIPALLLFEGGGRVGSISSVHPLNCGGVVAISRRWC